MNISDVFERNLLDPESSLRAVSITRFWAYLLGYMDALRDAGVPFDDKEFQDFCRWVPERYNLNTTNSCAEKVLFKSHGDEFSAMERMKLLWVGFKQERRFEK